MALVEGELVHHQTPGLRRRQRRHRSGQPALVQAPHRAPVQAEQLGHVGGGQPGTHHRYGIGQASGQPRMAIQPGHVLQAGAAVRAGQAAQGYLQDHGLAQHRQIAQPTAAALMHGQPRTLATPAAQRLARVGLQRDLDPVGADLEVGDNKSLPEREAGFTI